MSMKGIPHDSPFFIVKLGYTGGTPIFLIFRTKTMIVGTR